MEPITNLGPDYYDSWLKTDWVLHNVDEVTARLPISSSPEMSTLPLRNLLERGNALDRC